MMKKEVNEKKEVVLTEREQVMIKWLARTAYETIKADFWEDGKQKYFSAYMSVVTMLYQHENMNALYFICTLLDQGYSTDLTELTTEICKPDGGSIELFMNEFNSICNQKGGVGKTTTAANLGVALAMEGKKVLILDLDPQSDLSASLGPDRTDDLEVTVSTMMGKAINEEKFDVMEGIIRTDEGVYFLPSNLELYAMEMSLVGTMNRERVLKGYVDKVKNHFDFVIIDCMPSLGMITINALSASDSVIVPVQAHYLPAKGMEQLLNTVGEADFRLLPLF